MKNEKRLHGRIGYLRFALFMFMYIIYAFIFLIISVIVYALMLILLRLAGFHNINDLLNTAVLLFSIGIVLFIGMRWESSRKRYIAKAVTDTEYIRFQDYNLIHYTDIVDDQEILDFRNTGKIHLFANGSQESNYSMRGTDRKEKYVWFHVSDAPSSMEPEFNSFWFSHSGESTPRDFKVIVSFNALPRENLLIRAVDGAIMHRGDYVGPAVLEQRFEWYNQKLYLLSCLNVPFSEFFSLFVNAYQQGKGKINDRILRNKRS